MRASARAANQAVWPDPTRPWRQPSARRQCLNWQPLPVEGGAERRDQVGALVNWKGGGRGQRRARAARLGARTTTTAIL